MRDQYYEEIYMKLEDTPMPCEWFKKAALADLAHGMRYDWDDEPMEVIDKEFRRIKNKCRIKCDLKTFYGFQAWSDLFQINTKFERDHVEQFAYEMTDKSPTLDEYDARLGAIMSALKKMPAVQPGADKEIVVYLEPPMRALGD